MAEFDVERMIDQASRRVDEAETLVPRNVEAERVLTTVGLGMDDYAGALTALQRRQELLEKQRPVAQLLAEAGIIVDEAAAHIKPVGTDKDEA